MTDRALIIDTSTGAILRKFSGPPSMLAVNVGAGESAFQITDDDGLHIDDGNIVIDETGAWAAREGAPEGLTLPTTSIEYVPA